MSTITTRASAYPRTSKVTSLALVSILAIIVLAGAVTFAANSPSKSFNDVQVSIQTSKDLPYTYTVDVYNSSGYQVVSYQSNFSAAAFELPSGTYLFTAQASYGQGGYGYPCIGCTSAQNATGGPCMGCVQLNSTSGTTSTTVVETEAAAMFAPMALRNSTTTTNSTTGTNSTMPTVTPVFVLANSTTPTNSTSGGNVTTTVIPIFRTSSSYEYGYAIEQVSGPTSFTITTENSTSIPTTQVSVHVTYANGTAAAGAWVGASVVDGSFYYGPNVVSDVQTGTDGTAVLTMPTAPLIVTAYTSVPVNLHLKSNTTTVVVGGQKINVTIYYEPSSVYLQGQTLILPPATSGSITLQYQPQYWYPISPITPITVNPGGTVSTVTTVTTFSTTTSGTIGNAKAAIDKLPSFNLGGVKPVTTTAKPTAAKLPVYMGLMIVGVVAAIAAVAIVVQVTVRGNRKPSTVSAT